MTQKTLEEMFPGEISARSAQTLPTDSLFLEMCGLSPDLCYTATCMRAALTASRATMRERWLRHRISVTNRLRSRSRRTSTARGISNRTISWEAAVSSG